MTETNEDLQTRYDQLSESYEVLKDQTEKYLMVESFGELERELSEQGWEKLVSTFTHDFSIDGLRKINLLSRILFFKNPTIRRAVLVQALYVWGQGITLKAKSSRVNFVIKKFWNDRKNLGSLTDPLSQIILDLELTLFGNVYLSFITNEENGRVIVRTIPADEISEIYVNPEDRNDVWYYKRERFVTKVDPGTGTSSVEREVIYYPDWRYKPQDNKPDKIGNDEIRWQNPVYHIYVNKLSDMQFGVSEVFSVQTWARAYKGYLEDWTHLVKSLSKFAFQTSLKGAKLKTPEGRPLDLNKVTPGSVFAGGEGVKLETVKASGSAISVDDSRRLLLMISAGTGIPEHILSGDPSTSNLATSKTLERPLELMFKARQTVWKSVILNITDYVIDQSVKANAGLLKGEAYTDPYDGEEYIRLDKIQPALNDYALEEEVDAPEEAQFADRTIEVLFPDILEHDVAQSITSLISAATLDGKQLAGTIPLETLVIQLLTLLGIDDPDKIAKSVIEEKDKQDEERATTSAGRQDETEKKLNESLSVLNNYLSPTGILNPIEG